MTSSCLQDKTPRVEGVNANLVDFCYFVERQVSSRLDFNEEREKCVRLSSCGNKQWKQHMISAQLNLYQFFYNSIFSGA